MLARSLVRPVDEKDKNKRVSFDDTDDNSVVGEVVGSKTSDKNELELDLLTEMVNSNTPEVDITTVNGFDANDHVGMEFVKKDKRDVPTKVTVVKVDKDTGKVLLEYIHGGLELVSPNIIQEALLSRD